jgi:hypothetical protein
MHSWFVIQRLGEESMSATACDTHAGFFAKPQNDIQGNVHFPEPPNGSPLVCRLAMTDEIQSGSRTKENPAPVPARGCKS